MQACNAARDSSSEGDTMSKGVQAAVAVDRKRPSQAGPSTSTSQPASASRPLIKRIHISGLTQSLTPQDITSRFSSFGVEVLSVEPWLTSDQGSSGSTNIGVDKTYTYMNIAYPPASDEQGTQQVKAKLDRAKRLLSGSVWKGAKLRIGDAKPDWRQRHEAEKAAEEQAALGGDKKKSKRSTKMPGTVGKEAPNAKEPVTKDNVEEGEWVSDPCQCPSPSHHFDLALFKCRAGRKLPQAISSARCR